MLRLTMMHLTHPARLLLIFACMLPVIGSSQEPEAGSGLVDWQRQWEDAQAQESGTEADRLVEQTRIVEDLLESAIPVDSTVWDWTSNLLTRWEASPDIQSAREAYLSLLAGVCEPLTARNEPLPDEPALRVYLRKALGLTRSAEEEGRFLFYLAESWLRGGAQTEPLQRRVESLLQQSVAALESGPPLDAVHVRLGELYRTWGQASRLVDRENQENSYLTRAVSQFEMVTRMRDARAPLVESARDALTELRKPELELKIAHRFLPQNEVRVTLSSRNVDEVGIRLIALPVDGLAEAGPTALAQLEEILTSGEFTPDQLRSEETVSLRGRNPNDWRTREIGLGDSFTSGWYGVIVEGPGVVRRGMILVTPLEVAAIARAGDELLVWVVDGETGQPVPEATVSMLSENGENLVSGQTDLDGLLRLDDQGLSGWSELHVVSGPNPGHLRRADLPQVQPVIPWLIVNPSELEPGDTLQWCALAIDDSNRAFVEPGPVFTLPDGSVLEASTTGSGNGWATGSSQIPETLTVSGPIYATLPNGKQLYLAYVDVGAASPLDLSFTGEQLDDSLNLFLSSSTVGVQLSPVFGEDSSLPEFIRFRTTRMERRSVAELGDPATDEELVFESILPFEPGDRGGLLVELPEIATGNRLVPLHVEVLPLDGSESLADGTLGLSPFRRTIRLDMPEHIGRPGQPVEVSYSVETIGSSAPRPVEGEFIVYRETWESRYIHRRRGTTIPEEAYLALPDRSLLGSAKTDYRLMEQGFVREEVQRVPMESSESSGTVAVSIDRPGYYKIEFDSREIDTHADYPEGPLEIWLIPENGDLRIFRSERPRLIVESEADGTQEILVLLDRTRTSVLIDLERADGSILSQVRRPEEAALYLLFEEPGQSPIQVCRAVVVGNRRTDFLWRSESTATRADWDLDYDSLFGLNPGVEFRWPLELGADEPDGPILWSFFPESSYSLTPERLRWQRELHLDTRHQEEANTVTLSRWLPLLDPFPILSTQPDQTREAARSVWRDPEAFVSLFPEIKRPVLPPVALASPFEPVTLDSGTTGEAPVISGRFPNAAGRWQLALFSPTSDQDLQVRSWLISTELPVRSRLEGPPLLRVGDAATLWLSIENTTRRRVDLQAQVSADTGLSFEAALASPLSLQPTEIQQVPLQVYGLQAGLSRIDVRLEGLTSLSEALHSIEVIADKPVQKELEFSLAEPQQDDVSTTLSVAGWAEGEVLVASSLGPLLPEIWPLIRDAQQDREPLLTALGQWALRQVEMRHGTSQDGSDEAVETRLGNLLRTYQTPSGGWAWMPGLEADPWISSLVLWTLEIFSGRDRSLFADLRRDGRLYLESFIVEENLDPESRLFALRALASPAFHLVDVRPSRIQARSFLDLLHQREQLSDAEVALLLQVARAYGFKEEVGLLGRDLLQRFRDTVATSNRRFWSASLLNLSLDDNEVATDDGNALLLSALDSLARVGPRRSWEQVAGFLNLLAAYYWKGDFYTDGTVELTIDGGDPVSIPLGPELPGSGFLKFKLSPSQLDSEVVNLRLNTTSALSPVLIAAIGVSREGPSIRPLGSVGIEWYREYFEETLMQGMRRRVTQLNSTLDNLHTGDQLRVIVEAEILEDQSFAAFRFPVPAGFALDRNSIEHLWQPVEDAPMQDVRLWVDSGETAPALNSIVRIAPLPAGRHRFELSYEAMWAGTYAWPEMRLTLPRTGTTFRLSESTEVTILPLGD